MEQLGTDERMQQLLQQTEIGNSTAVCPSKNKATLMCVNPLCQHPSLHCQDCKQCEVHLQNSCLTFRIKSLTMSLNKENQVKKKVISAMMDLEDKMMQKLQQNKKRLLEIRGGTFFNKKQITFLETIYGKPDKKVNIIGNDAAKLVERLQSASQDTSNRQQYFAIQLEKLTQQIIQLENEVMDFEYRMHLNSKILPVGKKTIEFILKSLNSPIRLELLFRASQHDFLASQFHKKCDNIKHTLVLIKTQQGKVIGGYTPLKWNKAQKQHVSDNSNSSFVLSVTGFQKMRLINPKKAIYCDSSCGPIFGEDDIRIVNNCYNFEFSSTSYNSKSYDNRKTIEQFTGVRSGTLFRVEEYQVFRVVWEQPVLKEKEAVKQKNNHVVLPPINPKIQSSLVPGPKTQQKPVGNEGAQGQVKPKQKQQVEKVGFEPHSGQNKVSNHLTGQKLSNGARKDQCCAVF